MSLALVATNARAGTRAVEFKLDNGLELVVIPDHRAPIVSHTVWYRVGGADEPEGSSGIAHFLEHLMFKGTDKIPNGAFSKIVARNGGQDNAFTTQDATAYFQDVAKDRLPLMMEMESDRMRNLRLTEEDVKTERDVILEERRMRTDNNPSAKLSEQMDAALFTNHPYASPVIGWMHEIAQLSRADALAFYKKYYAPNNAIVVVAGDVEPDEVLKLAKETYGKVPAVPDISKRARPQEPPPVASRHLDIKDPRAGQASFDRDYLVPSYPASATGEPEALDLFARALGSGSTSRLYRKLLVEEQKVSSVGAYYSGWSLDSGKLSIYAAANDGVDLATVEKGVDAVLADVVKNGVTQAEIDRARNTMIADYVYEADSITSLAKRYGWRLAMGRSIADIENLPDRLMKVTLAEVNAAGRKYLDPKASVTGWLEPVAAVQPVVQ